MKMLSFDKMATLEGGGFPAYSRVCKSGLNLLNFAQSRNLGFLVFLACTIIRAYCPSSCACNVDTTVG